MRMEIILPCAGALVAGGMRAGAWPDRPRGVQGAEGNRTRGRTGQTVRKRAKEGERKETVNLPELKSGLGSGAWAGPFPPSRKGGLAPPVSAHVVRGG
ncbi:hypothetical protein DA2_1043 [Desulfovibrio sp. A2]|nr:hypothetical protein DA2_1043 [Desulfovibrio sp. A2]